MFSVGKIKHESVNQQINTVVNTVSYTQFSEWKIRSDVLCLQREKNTKPESV